MTQQEESSLSMGGRGETISHSIVYDWQGQLIILYYTGGPFPNDFSKVETGNLESKSGVFGLAAVDDIGIMVRKARIEEGDDLVDLDEDVRFIPWGSVNSIYPLSKPNERDTEPGTP